MCGCVLGISVSHDGPSQKKVERKSAINFSGL